MTLNELRPGDSCVVSDILSEKAEKVAVLDIGLVPGTLITREITPTCDGSAIIKVRGSRLALGGDVMKCVKIYPAAITKNFSKNY